MAGGCASCFSYHYCLIIEEGVGGRWGRLRGKLVVDVVGREVSWW